MPWDVYLSRFDCGLPLIYLTGKFSYLSIAIGLASWKPLLKKKIHKENKDINVVNEYLYLFPLISARALVFDMAGVLSWKLPINVIIVSMGWRFILEITNKC